MRATDRRASASLLWSAIALSGLLVGVVALGSDSWREGPGTPASRLLVELPNVVVTLATVAGTLAVLLWFAFLLALARRRRKDAPPERALWGTLLFALIVTAVAIWHPDVPPRQWLPWSGREAMLDRLMTPEDDQRPTISSPVFTSVAAAATIAAALASLGLAGFLLFGDRLVEGWRRPARAERRPLAVAVDESLEDLREEADARRAIIRCYGRFEDALARSRVPRAPWQTPLEFMRDALARLPLPAAAVERLTQLFERARFGNEPLGRADRDTALGSLVEIRQSLGIDEDAR